MTILCGHPPFVLILPPFYAGLFKTGYLADFVVLSDNIFELAPDKMEDVRVGLAVINGSVVYKP